MLETLQKAAPPTNGTMDSTRSQSAGNVNDLIWLCGFIDGEGCIGFIKGSDKKQHRYPNISITNTHKQTMERVLQILSDFGIRYWISNSPARQKAQYKQDWVVVVKGLKRAKPFLELITPYLFTKKLQAQAVLEFINRRMSVPSRSLYGDREYELFSLLSKLNHRGPSETTRVLLQLPQ